MADNTLSLAQALTSTLESVEASIAKRIPEEIETQLRAALADYRPSQRELVVRVEGSSLGVNVGRQHEAFETLLKAVSAGVPVWLTGPAGSGKTMGAEKASEGLGLAFSAVSIGPQTTQAHLFGYMDATGTYRGTQVRERFEHGGLLLIDEIDRGNPGVLTSLNALLANNVCAFPDGMIQRHPDFRIVAAANTIGMGADRQYVGALQLDASTLDRFVVIEWPYDAAFERDLAHGMGNGTGSAWCDRIQTLRKAAENLKLRCIISPRATFNGIRLLAAGLDKATVENMTVWSSIDAASKTRILEQAGTLPAESEASEDDRPDDGPETPTVTGQACPRCGKSSSVISSKFTPGTLVCWKRRHGCGHRWSV